VPAGVTTAIVVGVVVVALLALLAVGLRFRRRAIADEQRRVEALTTLAVRLNDLNASLPVPPATAEPPPRPPAPLPPIEPGGRAAFLDALTDAVARARADSSRLTVAVVESGATVSAALAGDVRDVTAGDAYEVGPRAVALVVEGAGRADALGVLARIQAACGATGNAVELEPGDDAVALVARLLAARREAAAAD
jgi:hypothetical protein